MVQRYPLFIDLSGKRCVIVGGGPVAQKRAEGLLSAGAAVVVVSPTATPDLQRWAGEGALEWAAREASASDANGAFLVVTAADQADTNERMADAARRAGALTNRADDGEAGDVMFPAIVRRGDLVLAVSASGSGPALAARIARELEAAYGAEYAEYAALLRRVRWTVKRLVPDAAERRRLLAAAATDEALREWREARWFEGDERHLLARLKEMAGGAGSSAASSEKDNETRS